MAVLSIDTLYTTYNGYTTADALDYAQSPLSGTYTTSTKVNAITVRENYVAAPSRGNPPGGTFGFTTNDFCYSLLTVSLVAGATPASISTTWQWPLQGSALPAAGLYAIIDGEIVNYSSYTTAPGPGGTFVTDLNGLKRGLAGTTDSDHLTTGPLVTVYPLEPGIITAIEQDKELEVFNIHTRTTIVDPNGQEPTHVINDMYTIPESLVSMVKYTDSVGQYYP